MTASPTAPPTAPPTIAPELLDFGVLWSEVNDAEVLGAEVREAARLVEVEMVEVVVAASVAVDSGLSPTTRARVTLKSSLVITF